MKRSHSDKDGVDHLPVPHPTIRARSISASSTFPPPIHDIHFVLSQVPGLLTIIGPYLDLKVKLTQLTRLHRSFPALPPACFQSNEVDLSSPQLLVALTASPTRLALLRHMAAIAFDAVAATDSQLFVQRVLPLFSPPRSLDFPFLHTLTLSMAQQKDYSLAQLFSSPASFPSLHTLRLSTNQPYPSTPDDRWDVTPLSHLPLLRTLTLSGVGLSPHSFLFLLQSLHLHSLDLSDRVLLTRFEAVDNEMPAIGVVPSETLRTLFLPDYDADEDGVLIDAVLSGLAQQCVVSDNTGGGEWQQRSSDGRRGLAHLQVACTKLSDCTIGHIASISSLATLDLVCSPLINPLPLYNAATNTPRLPALRHLSLTGVSDCEDEFDAQRISAMLGAHLGFLMAYSRQLHILELDVLEIWPYTTEHVLPFIMVALHCPQLRALRLSGERQSHSLIKPPEPAPGPPLLPPRGQLVHLHSLHFDSLPLDETDLSIVLEHCPSLQDCRLKALECLAVEDALLTLGGKCRQLRRLEFTLSSTAAGSTIVRAIDPTLVHPTLFPCLAVLSITADISTDVAAQSAFVNNLVQLLRSATQLHFLRLDIPVALHLLAQFAALTSLRAFRAWHRLPAALHRYYQSELVVRHSGSGMRSNGMLCREEVLPGVEMERVERQRCGWLDDSDSGSGWDDTYVFVEAGGREGFFAAIGQLQQ